MIAAPNADGIFLSGHLAIVPLVISQINVGKDSTRPPYKKIFFLNIENRAKPSTVEKEKEKKKN